MALVLVPLAEGFEDLEAITITRPDATCPDQRGDRGA